MTPNHISAHIPDVISITKVRQDIDALTELLEKHRRVRVLRGQDVLFEAVRPETDWEKQERVKRAVEAIRRIRESTKRTKHSASGYVIKARDRILAGKDL